MGPQQREQRDDPVESVNKVIGLLLTLAYILSAYTQMYLRKVGTMGSRYPLKWEFVVGMVVPLLFEVWLNPSGDHTPTGLFTAVGVALMLLHWLKRCKYDAHSYYCGESGLGRGKRVYTVWEPAVAMVAGCLALFLSPALGIYLIASGFASAMVFTHLASRDAARLRAMSDAEHENRAYLAAYRESKQ